MNIVSVTTTVFIPLQELERMLRENNLLNEKQVVQGMEVPTFGQKGIRVMLFEDCAKIMPQFNKEIVFTPAQQLVLDRTTMEDLDLSVRARNALKRIKIHSLRELLNWSADQLLGVEKGRIGNATVDEIEGILSPLGLQLRKDL